jgi:hypothetical protein
LSKTIYLIAIFVAFHETNTHSHTKADIWCNYLDGARFAKGALEEKLHEYMVTVARVSVH